MERNCRNKAGFDKIVSLLDSAVDDGAQILCGGQRGADESGYYFEPTVVGACTHQMDIVTQEIFGPVIPVVIFDEIEEAIAMANDTEYGLTSSVFSNDINEAMNLVKADLRWSASMRQKIRSQTLRVS